MKYAMVYTKYTIKFNALTADGEEVAKATYQITTNRQLDLQRKPLCFRRMCVEYARLIGIKCSDVEITAVEKILETEGETKNDIATVGIDSETN